MKCRCDPIVIANMKESGFDTVCAGGCLTDEEYAEEYA